MKRLLLGLALAFGLMLTTPTTYVAADSDSDSADSDSGPRFRARSGGSTSGGTIRSSHAPELDPTLGGSAMLLLLGGVAYLASRKRDDE